MEIGGSGLEGIFPTGGTGADGIMPGGGKWAGGIWPIGGGGVFGTTVLTGTAGTTMPGGGGTEALIHVANLKHFPSLVQEASQQGSSRQVFLHSSRAALLTGVSFWGGGGTSAPMQVMK